MAQKFYVDVTQLAHWSGKITGIPRVMDELARRFAVSDSNTVFVVWVKDLQEFCEIDFEQTIVQRKGLVYRHMGEAEKGEGLKATSVPASQRSRQLLKRVAKKGLSAARRVHPGLAQKAEARAKAVHMQSYKRVEFQKGDSFFIPWGEWWDQHFTARLVRAHNDEGVHLVQIIHDIATTVWPQFFEQVPVNPASYNAKIVPIADLVLCVSENTKKELTEWLKAQKLHVPRIEVFRLGDDIRATESSKPQDPAFVQAQLRGNDYVMCVGTIEAKKNHALFYYVYKQAKARGISLPKLVIVGRRGWGTDDIYAIMTQDPEVCDQFVFLHNVGDEELAWLYDHCLFTVLPSFHEGWGIPIAESVSRGIPCLCSNTSSMVEIAEGIVDHFSPTSTDECLAGMQRLLDPGYYKAAKALTKTYHPTSWDDSFQQVAGFVSQLTVAQK